MMGELLKILAQNICKELSIKNLSKSLHVDINTLNSCMDILEKNFIIFIREYHSKLKSNTWWSFKRIFFWDNGIRNAILNNFNPLSKRKDANDLWENFVVSDAMKKHSWIRTNHRFTSPISTT